MYNAWGKEANKLSFNPNTFPSTTLGSVAIYECDVGYSLYPPDATRRRCMETGSWSGVPPRCNSKLSLAIASEHCVSNVSSLFSFCVQIKQTNRHTAIQRRFCFLRKKLLRWFETEISRLTDCTFASCNNLLAAMCVQRTSKVTVCHWLREFCFWTMFYFPVVTCIVPSKIDHGSVSLSPLVSYGTSVTYTCDVGYKLSGSYSR